MLVVVRNWLTSLSLAYQALPHQDKPITVVELILAFKIQRRGAYTCTLYKQVPAMRGLHHDHNGQAYQRSSCGLGWWDGNGPTHRGWDLRKPVKTTWYPSFGCCNWTLKETMGHTIRQKLTEWLGKEHMTSSRTGGTRSCTGSDKSAIILWIKKWTDMKNKWTGLRMAYECLRQPGGCNQRPMSVPWRARWKDKS